MKLRSAILFVALTLLLTACYGQSAQPQTAAPPVPSSAPAIVPTASVPSPVAARPATNPTEKTHLVFGGAVTPPSMVHLPPYIAKDMGFFDEVGLDVDIISFEGGVGALRGGIAGSLDIVATS